MKRNAEIGPFTKSSAAEDAQVVIAGLTGGIASGKSMVSAVLAEAGARVIDADRIAREAARKGTAVHADIVAHFGRGILLPDGEIDRRRLGDIVFKDPVEKQVLEGFIHPWVREETARRLERIRCDDPNAVVILEVPLLFETGMHHGLEEVIVVYAPEAAQLARLMARDRLAPAEALARIRSQMPIDQKKALATQVIDNSGSREHTRTQTLDVYRRLTLRPGKDLPKE
jgi:dephospho-CoA kinase